MPGRRPAARPARGARWLAPARSPWTQGGRLAVERSRQWHCHGVGACGGCLCAADAQLRIGGRREFQERLLPRPGGGGPQPVPGHAQAPRLPCPCTAADRKSTRLNSSHLVISYAVFCLKKKKISIQDSLRHQLKVAKLANRRNRPLVFIYVRSMSWLSTVS